MKASVTLLLVGTLSAVSQTITFTNKTATFTNLEGRAYRHVELTKADLDGVIWRDENGGGGRVSYTNLHPSLLSEWGLTEQSKRKTSLLEARRVAEEARRAAEQKASEAALEAQSKAEKEKDDTFQPEFSVENLKLAEAAIEKACQEETGFRRVLTTAASLSDKTKRWEGWATYEIINNVGGVEKKYMRFRFNWFRSGNVFAHGVPL